MRVLQGAAPLGCRASEPAAMSLPKPSPSGVSCMSEDYAVKDLDYVVKDIALADFGRKEIEIAETEMPGLMALRAEFGADAAAEGRAHRRLAAHDDPDRGADRDADRARRRGALGLLQHLLDPGPRRRGDRRRRRPGLRGQGRDARGLLDLHRPHLRLRRRRQHDPRRRRRRDDVHPDRRPGRGGRDRAHREPRQRGGRILLRPDQEAHGRDPRLVRQASATPSAASPRRRRPACTASTS